MCWDWRAVREAVVLAVVVGGVDGEFVAVAVGVEGRREVFVGAVVGVLVVMDVGVVVAVPGVG